MRSAFGTAASLALAFASTPALAQEESGFTPAFTPEEDLDCAIYIGAVMAETAAEMTPESRVALTSAYTYFIGRYEAQRGHNLATALSERYAAFSQNDPQALEQTCSLRARGFAARMEQAGRVAPQSVAPAQGTSDAAPPASEGSGDPPAN